MSTANDSNSAAFIGLLDKKVIDNIVCHALCDCGLFYGIHNGRGQHLGDAFTYLYPKLKEAGFNEVSTK